MTERDLRRLAEDKYLKKACGGDVFCFEELVRSHESFVFSICLSYLKNEALAEDAAQEVFIKAWRGISRFRGESTFSTWLFTISKNVCRDISAKKRCDEPLCETLVSEESVEERVIKNDDESRLYKALLKLPEDARSILILREWRGLSYAQIAEILGVEKGTVKSRLSRAREKLIALFCESAEQKEKKRVK